MEPAAELLARTVGSRPRRLLAGLGIVTVACAVAAVPVLSRLHVTTREFYPHGSQSARANDTIERATGSASNPTVVALFHTPHSVVSEAGLRALQMAATAMQRTPGIARVVSIFQASTEWPTLVSYDRHWAVIGAYLRAGVEGTSRVVGVISALRRHLTGVGAMTLGGSALVVSELASEVRAEIHRVEPWLLVVLFCLLVWVFGGAFAAALPLLAGIATFLEVLCVFRVLERLGMHLSLLVVPLVSGLSLGLSIDYSLLLLARARSERRQPYGNELKAVVWAAAVKTGRTVLFSALAIACSFAALLLFPVQLLSAAGVAGASCALLSAVNTLLLVPAAILVVGPGLLEGGWWTARREARSRRRWRVTAIVVTRRPLRVVLPVSVVLIVLAIPALGLHLRGVDASSLPPSASARRVEATLASNFNEAASNEAMTVAVRTNGASTAELQPLLTRITRLPGVLHVTDAVLVNPSLLKIQLLSTGAQLSSASESVVRDVRNIQEFHPEVTGPTASYIDQQASLREHAPVALSVLALGVLITLFAMTGSAVIPVKAMILSLLSFAATFGVLVLVFQYGVVAGILGIHKQGALEAMQPILMFGAVCGLSIDYNAFVIARIQEARVTSASERDAVARGLYETGPVITTAAFVFCVTVLAFAFSPVLLVKETSIGMALAVGIDATVVRGLLMPAIMALLGKYNWWAPSFLRGTSFLARPNRQTGSGGQP